jgi:hypothetical protein
MYIYCSAVTFVFERGLSSSESELEILNGRRQCHAKTVRGKKKKKKKDRTDKEVSANK